MPKPKPIFRPKESKKTQIILLIIVVLLIAGGVAYYFLSPQTEEPEQATTEQTGEITINGVTVPDPTDDKIVCDRIGGKIVELPEGSEVCADRYQDAGLTCNDSSECLGKCFAVEDSEETSLGECEEYSVTPGSPATVSNGQVLETILE